MTNNGAEALRGVPGPLGPTLNETMREYPTAPKTQFYHRKGSP